MKILNRYVLKEHLGPLAFSLTALTSLLLLNYIAKQFGNLVGKGLPWSVIVEFFVLSIPFTVAMTLPMAVLVSVLYAFSRLASENEITALKASGVSLVRVLVPVLWGATMLAALMVGFNDQILPRANHELRVLQGDIARKKPTFALREQVINEVASGKLYLRANKVDQSSNIMREVTIYDLGDPTRRRTIYADSGTMRLMAGASDLELTLWSGEMREVQRNDPAQLQRLFYTSDRIRVRGVGNSFEQSEHDDFKGDREMSICEMEQAFATSRRDYETSRRQLADALGGAAHLLATGERVVRPTSPPASAHVPPSASSPSGAPPAATTTDTGAAARPPFGVARLYCGALAWAAKRLPSGKATTTTVAGLTSAGASAAAAALAPQAAVAQAATPAARPVTGSGIRRGADSTRKAAAAAPVRPPPARMPAPLLPPPSAGVATEGRSPALPYGAGARGTVGATMGGTMDASLAVNQVTAELDAARIRMQDTEQSMNGYDVEIQKKFALAVACIVFVLLGAPIALRFPRGGVGLTIGVSLGVFALYYVCLIAGEELANRGFMPPFWAMWAANVLFTLIGLVLLARMGREGGTSRGGDTGELVEQLRLFLKRQLRRVGIRVDRRAPAT